MKSVALVILAAGALSLLAVAAQQSRPAEPPADRVARGRYITEHVAMCIQCHTPRTESGDLDRTRLFHGAPMPVRSPWPNQEWAYETPKIAGLPGWTDEDAINFLMKGKDPRGYVPRPPMPPFRMTREDAESVVAFLRTMD